MSCFISNAKLLGILEEKNHRLDSLDVLQTECVPLYFIYIQPLYCDYRLSLSKTGLSDRDATIRSLEVTLSAKDESISDLNAKYTLSLLA